MAASGTPADGVEIRSYQPGDAEWFRTLNEEWIERYFRLEPKDREVLGDPETYILKPGGSILMATADGEPAGCCALQVLDDETFEISKMAVRPKYQGRGLGKQLMVAAIREGRRLGAKRLYIETNSQLTPAMTLYSSCGFQPVANDRLKPSPYQRANVHLELWLTA